MTSRATVLTLAVTLAGIATAVSTPAAAHPFHITLAEAEYNPESDRLEVALKVWPPDLDRALERRLDRDVDLDTDDDIETRVAEYIAAVFRVFDASGKSVPQEWIGMELDLSEGWIYFQLPLPDGPRGIRISNSAFFELEEDQVNTVNLRLPPDPESEGEQRITLTLTSENPFESLP